MTETKEKKPYTKPEIVSEEPLYTPLTDIEKGAFQHLLDSHAMGNLYVIRAVSHDGERKAVIADMRPLPNEEVLVLPIAVLIKDVNSFMEENSVDG